MRATGDAARPLRGRFGFERCISGLQTLQRPSDGQVINQDAAGFWLARLDEAVGGLAATCGQAGTSGARLRHSRLHRSQL